MLVHDNLETHIRVGDIIKPKSYPTNMSGTVLLVEETGVVLSFDSRKHYNFYEYDELELSSLCHI